MPIFAIILRRRIERGDFDRNWTFVLVMLEPWMKKLAKAISIPAGSAGWRRRGGRRIGVGRIA